MFTNWTGVSRRRLLLCLPKALESIGRELGVADGVLDIFVPEPVLQGPCVDAVVSELVAP